MRNITSHNFRQNQSGSLITVTAMMLVLIFIILHFSLDLTSTQSDYTRLQNTNDSTALAVADFIAKGRKDQKQKSRANYATWLPTQAEALAFATKVAAANYSTSQAHSILQDFNIEMTNITNGAQVKVSLCAIAENNIQAFSANPDGKNTVCTSSTALIEGLPFGSAEFAITWDSMYGTSNESSNAMVSVFTDMMSKYFIDKQNMEDNDLYVSFIPFTTSVNLAPFDDNFIKPTTNPPSNSDILNTSLYERTKAYPVFDDEDFNRLISDTPSDMKFRSVYDYFRYQKVGGKRGEFFEDTFPVFNTETKKYKWQPKWNGSKYVEDNANGPQVYRGYQDMLCKKYDSVNGVTELPTAFDWRMYSVMWSCDQKYYKLNVFDEAKKRYIQPLTNNYNVMMKAISTPKSGMYLSNFAPHCNDPITNTDIHDVYDTLPQEAKDYFFDPEVLNDDYSNSGFSSSNAYYGIMWAWLTLSEKTKNMWNQKSYFENQLSVNPNRTDLPVSATESGKKKVIIQVMSDAVDINSHFEAMCDPYVQYLGNSVESFSKQAYASWFIDTPEWKAGYGGDNKPASAASYEKLCNRLKKDNIDLYILNFSRNYYYHQDDIYRNCAGPENYIVLQDQGLSLSQGIDKVMGNYFSTEYRIRLVK